ncbi:hypothetical protein QYF36_007518 [Acer negundo]|nr:hypothetical protein QYF36_007518 [Acer negundo]
MEWFLVHVDMVSDDVKRLDFSLVVSFLGSVLGLVFGFDKPWCKGLEGGASPVQDTHGGKVAMKWTEQVDMDSIKPMVGDQGPDGGIRSDVWNVVLGMQNVSVGETLSLNGGGSFEATVGTSLGSLASPLKHERDDSSCGLCLIWNGDVDVTLLSFSHFHIDVVVISDNYDK